MMHASVRAKLSRAYHGVLRAICDMHNHKNKEKDEMISTHQLIVEANALLIDVLISKKRILYAIRFAVWAPPPVARMAILLPAVRSHGYSL